MSRTPLLFSYAHTHRTHPSAPSVHWCLYSLRTRELDDQSQEEANAPRSSGTSLDREQTSGSGYQAVA